MQEGLTKGDRARAALAAASTVVAVPVGIALTAQGSGLVAGAWIVMTPLVAGNAWVLTGRPAWADHRGTLLIRLLGALGAAGLAVLALAVVDDAAMQGLVAVLALICALAAVAAHRDLPFQRDMAIQGV